MLELPEELLEYLNHGGTLIVPTRQRAAAVRLAHSAAQIASGHRSWNSPDVLAWSGWLERSLDEGCARQAGAPRRLSASEEWLCWRDAVQAAGAEAVVLFADALVDSVRRAITLLDDYALPLSAAVSAESMLLLGARRFFRERCAQRRALGTTSWQDCAQYIRLASPARLAGFTALGAARRRWLEQLGVRIEESAVGPVAGATVQDYADPEAEAAAASDWCAGVLAGDPYARILLVVPRLAEQAHRWQRALGERLEYRVILDPRAASEPAAFVREGGAPLRSHPLISSALDLIALSAGEADFDSLSAVLRSPHFPALDAGARLIVDVWLREHNVDTAEPALLRGLIPTLERAAGAAAAGALAALLDAIAQGEAGDAGPESPAQWAARYLRRLNACGWPGAGLASAEQQARARFDELLNDFAALAAQPRLLVPSQACALLEQLAARGAFEPASDDVPVTLTASLDDPIVHYDGVWIAGLSADVWPAPAQPDPLIPMALQLTAGLPGVTSAGQRQLALAALARWGRAARSLQCSWARSEGDLDCEPSPLLAECSASQFPEAPRAALFLLEAAIAHGAPELERWSDAIGPRWNRSGVLHGGTRLLELQSRCPFRSFAELRLRARPLPQPVPGIDALARGRILHRALELFWRAVQNSAALQQHGEDAARLLTQRCVARALQEAQAVVPGLLPPRLLAAEGVRAEQLMERVLEWERTREPFAIEALEWPVSLELGGAMLQLRLDRVDVLGDGARIVIDYKSGAADPFEPAALRPAQPQLPAYALAAGPGTRGVLVLQLFAEGLQLRGAVDRVERVAGLKIGASGHPGWAELQQHWLRELTELVREFLDGEARVAPQPGACEHCHLEVFCRIEHPRTGGST